MARYRTVPVEVDAVQWFKHGDHEAVEMYPASMSGNCWGCDLPLCSHGFIPDGEDIMGGYAVCPGDWIVTEANGDEFPCTQARFAATYVPVDGEGAADAE